MPYPARAAWGAWRVPALRAPALVAGQQFRFLGRTEDLDERGWDDPELAKLWRYNLHYFDDLVSIGWETKKAEHHLLIRRWIAENPAPAGTGWEPYPLSRRIVNWVKWLCAGNTAPDGMIESLAIQTQWLTRRIEYHLLGNHLFTNAKALLFAGLFFSGEVAGRWRARGLSLLEREVEEQFLADGGHFELSTMYHALAVEDLLDLINIIGASGSAADPALSRLSATLAHKAARAIAWMRLLQHPDGEIAFFNDAAIGIAPPPDDLVTYAERLSIAAMPLPSTTLLADSGYGRAQRGRAVLFADIARIGCEYLPGHGHADTLTFELSLGEQRFIVNSGTSEYGTGAERLRQRGTPAHNTVTVDGQDSSEVWSGFRVGRRARPSGVAIVDDASGVQITGSHDGYRWLTGRPRHTRRWVLDSHSLTIQDALLSGSHHRAWAAYHFHPNVLLDIDPAGTRGRAWTKAGEALEWCVERGEAKILPSTYHPRFGSTMQNRKLVIALDGGAAAIKFEWAPA